MHNPSLLDKFSLNVVRKNIPTCNIDVNSKGRDADGNRYVFNGHIEHSQVDYWYFIDPEKRFGYYRKV